MLSFVSLVYTRFNNQKNENWIWPTSDSFCLVASHFTLLVQLVFIYKTCELLGENIQLVSCATQVALCSIQMNLKTWHLIFKDQFISTWNFCVCCYLQNSDFWRDHSVVSLVHGYPDSHNALKNWTPNVWASRLEESQAVSILRP